MKLDDGRLTFVAQQEVTALDAIHKAALGKAACAGRVTEGVGTCISIHAPTWGATTHKSVSQTVTQNFNPRTHVGCDGGHGLGTGHGEISIHAPTWGATHIRRRPRPLDGISIHAPTWGATPLGRLGTQRSRFQSTHPRGVRPPSCARGTPQRDFNPRTHVECDPLELSGSKGSLYFNPRTHVGCDKAFLRRGSRPFNFNPRTHVGCDMDVKFLTGMIYISIHAPTWGATGDNRD